jgi:adenylosuccinate lyase
MDAETNNLTFNEAISTNSIVNKYLETELIHKILKPENYIGHSEEIVDKVLDSI